MLTIQEIEREVAQLSRVDLSRFRRWFEMFDAELWDRQFEEDAKSGKLDQLAARAIADFEAGNYREL
ncbi:MAG: hypothetical protein K1X65_06815 [Caldilineales bacterium]|nr:hypothetical protein [Caldilineales bacterium]